MAQSRPASVRRVVALVYAMLGLLAVGTALTFVYHEQLILSWAEGNEAAQTIVRDGGIEALERSAIHVPGFSALAITSCVTYAMLAWVLVAFLLGRHHWARWSLVAVMGFTAFMGALGLAQSLPVPFVIVSAAGVLMALATIFFLFRRDLGDYLRLL